MSVVNLPKNLFEFPQHDDGGMFEGRGNLLAGIVGRPVADLSCPYATGLPFLVDEVGLFRHVRAMVKIFRPLK